MSLAKDPLQDASAFEVTKDEDTPEQHLGASRVAVLIEFAMLYVA